MTDTQRAAARVAADLECIALVREAVAAHRANLAAIRDPEHRPDRLPGLDLEAWYRRAGEAVDVLDSTEA